MIAFHWYHIVNIVLGIPYFFFFIFSIYKLFDLYHGNVQRKGKFQFFLTPKNNNKNKGTLASTATTTKTRSFSSLTPTSSSGIGYPAYSTNSESEHEDYQHPHSAYYEGYNSSGSNHHGSGMESDGNEFIQQQNNNMACVVVDDEEDDDVDGNNGTREEVFVLRPKKYNVNALKQFFFWQMIPFYGIRFVLFETLGFSGVDISHGVNIVVLKWIAIFMCLYIIGGALVHNCYFLTALYWSEHVSYHHGLGHAVVERKMKASRVIFLVFSALWLIFESSICGLTIYYVYQLRETCFGALRRLIHIQYGFDMFLSLSLGIWFIVYAYIRKRSLFNWNTELDMQQSDPFVQHVAKQRKRTFVFTIVCITIYLSNAIFSLVYFETYQAVFHSHFTKKNPGSTEEFRVTLGFWITKGAIDFVCELLSFSLYFVFSAPEFGEEHAEPRSRTSSLSSASEQSLLLVPAQPRKGRSS